ncbi:hypothetical protein RhiirC2_778344 [Rhizophagus irregularis]|uniref:Uncharacterized protein n=1 Tax=Rhizophagus irregularis TaxID=588596 RepID=A0A2N1NCH3_9GLOM|nr:hypothetical protein RhiirC2_778344 [Rhizophagus irregularis]
MAIEKDNNRISYLMQKAEILAEIELFYLLPHQRRWHTWFPEAVDETSLPQLLEEVLEEVQSIRENSLHQLLEEIQKIQPKS